MTDIHRRLVKSASQLNLSKYKNQRAQPGQPYVPTRQEHLANILSHLFMIPASLYRMYTMLSRSADSAQTITSLIYGASGICLFLISSLFHIFAFRGGPCQLKEIFHRCDRVFIYIFIAASYTPWLVLRDFEYDIGTSCMYTVWTAAILGITYQLLFHEKHKWLEVSLYLVVGIAPGVLVSLRMKNPDGLFELILGGAIYVFGVVFFKLDGILPFAHAIWHLFVVAGAVLHFDAVATHLVGQIHDDMGF